MRSEPIGKEQGFFRRRTAPPELPKKKCSWCKTGIYSGVYCWKCQELLRDSIKENTTFEKYLEDRKEQK